MLFHLIALLSIGLGTAGLVIGLARLARRSPPRWLAPLAGGIAMFGFVLWSEYSWFARTRAALPDEMAVVRAHPDPSVFRPWTLISAPVERFAAVDQRATRRFGAEPDLALVELLLISRYEAPVRVLQAIDCAGERRGDLDAERPVGERGAPAVSSWQPLAEGDPILEAACRAP